MWFCYSPFLFLIPGFRGFPQHPPIQQLPNQANCTPRQAHSRAAIYLGMVRCVLFLHLRTRPGVNLRICFVLLSSHSTAVKMQRSPPQQRHAESCTSGCITLRRAVLSRCLVQCSGAIASTGGQPGWKCLAHQAEK